MELKKSKSNVFFSISYYHTSIIGIFFKYQTKKKQSCIYKDASTTRVNAFIEFLLMPESAHQRVYNILAYS